jgi:hypothetical protein
MYSQIQYVADGSEPTTSAYKSAYVTANIGNSTVHFDSVRLIPGDLSWNGQDIADRVWDGILEDVFAEPTTAELMEFVQPKATYAASSSGHDTSGTASAPSSEDNLGMNVVGALLFVGMRAMDSRR